MKSVTVKNKMNGEKFVCDDFRYVEIIDGVEYLLIRRFGTERKFLMRKEALEKVQEKIPQ